jgi:hypothetical protein
MRIKPSRHRLGTGARLLAGDINMAMNFLSTEYSTLFLYDRGFGVGLNINNHWWGGTFIVHRYYAMVKSKSPSLEFPDVSISKTLLTWPRRS